MRFILILRYIQLKRMLRKFFGTKQTNRQNKLDRRMLMTSFVKLGFSFLDEFGTNKIVICKNDSLNS